MNRFAVASLSVAVALASGRPLAAKDPDRLPPWKAFEAIQETAKKGGADALAACLSADLVRDRPDWSDEKTKAWRAGWVKRLGAWKITDAPKVGDSGALVRCTDAAAGEDHQMLLAWRGGQWVLDVGDPWLVKGKALDAVRGSSPAKLRLEPRTAKDAYGKSAFSFAHVTADPALCLNRMDVWFCKSGWLHASGDSKVAAISKADFAKLEGIPADAAFGGQAKPAKGDVLVVRCARHGHRDFYVKAHVTAVGAKGLDLEWTVLAAGFGSPPGLKGPYPLKSNDGADGTDALCNPH